MSVVVAKHSPPVSRQPRRKDSSRNQQGSFTAPIKGKDEPVKAAGIFIVGVHEAGVGVDGAGVAWSLLQMEDMWNRTLNDWELAIAMFGGKVSPSQDKSWEDGAWRELREELGAKCNTRIAEIVDWISEHAERLHETYVPESKYMVKAVKVPFSLLSELSALYASTFKGMNSANPKAIDFDPKNKYARAATELRLIPAGSIQTQREPVKVELRGFCRECGFGRRRS